MNTKPNVQFLKTGADALIRHRGRPRLLVGTNLHNQAVHSGTLRHVYKKKHKKTPDSPTKPVCFLESQETPCGASADT